MLANVKRVDLPTQSEFHQAIAHRGDRWYSACLRITRSPELAADAVQDALLNAWKHRHQFQRGARLDTWIHRIAVNSALSLLRKQHPERWVAQETDIADDSPIPEHIHAGHQLGVDLNRAMKKLTEAERICFVLKHLEQWRLKEISDELNTSIGTVKQAVFRAVKKLRLGMTDLRSAS
jgi:RNA polymerase sigma-70 factor (ECF subfamily)